MKIGYHLSSEEHPTQTLIDLAKRAEEAGFSFAFISDHYHPWISAQGQSPFVWTTIGGISQVTKKLQIITGVTCPILRIHPVIIAQAAATCAQLLEGRFMLGLGTGENLNEHVVGLGWPRYPVRQEMLIEAIEIIRLLFEGGYKDYFGEYYTVEDARLYSLPKTLPLILVAAGGPNSARLAGQAADGLISTSLAKEVMEAFSASGGEGKPKYAQIAVCYDTNAERAKKTVLSLWPTKGLKRPLGADLPTPKHFEAATATVREEDLREGMALGPDKEKHTQAIRRYFDAGYDYVAVHQIGYNQEEFFKFYEKEILPEFKK